MRFSKTWEAGRWKYGDSQQRLEERDLPRWEERGHRGEDFLVILIVSVAAHKILARRNILRVSTLVVIVQLRRSDRLNPPRALEQSFTFSAPDF